MSLKRREVLQATRRVLAASVLAASRPAVAETVVVENFSIDNSFVEFMRDIGGTPGDGGGGSVTFTGQAPIRRSRFRLGACMAVSAMAGGMGAAAVWRERTGQAQDLGNRPAPGCVRHSALGTLPRRSQHSRGRHCRWTGCRSNGHGGQLSTAGTSRRPSSSEIHLPLRCLTPRTAGRSHATGIYPHNYAGFYALIGAAPDQWGMEPTGNLAVTPDTTLTPGIQLIFNPLFNSRADFIAVPDVKFRIAL